MTNKTNKIPHGREILHQDWPDATWDLGGLFVHDNEIFGTLDEVQRRFDCILPIKSVFGCYSVMWSGGRNVHAPGTPHWNYHGWTPEVIIKEYNKRGINVTFTFSNTLLKEEHLADPGSNYLLDLLGKQEYEGNAVTVTSDMLSDYIKDKYPALKQKASIVKITAEAPKKRTAEYYESLFEKFDLVYLHPDDNFDFKLLKELAETGRAEKYTPLINEPCVRNCNIRSDHYDEYSRKVIDGWHGMFNFTTVDNVHDRSHPNTICPSVLHKELRTCVVHKDDFKKIYELGFRNFKLQGRDASWEFVNYNISEWMVEQNFIANQFHI